MDTLPQRQLALELRFAIDEARRSGRADARDRVKTLLLANPDGVTSQHVIHNLGAERMAWLAELLNPA